MQTLKVNRINDYDYAVQGKEIDAQARFYDKWDRGNRVRGKGSRKFKDEILRAVEEFKTNEERQRREQAKKEMEEKRQQLIQSEKYKEIDLLRLYEVERVEYDHYTQQHETFNGLLTGYEIKDSLNSVTDFQEHKINNTDFYFIGSDHVYYRDSLIDDRIIIMGLQKYAYVTGLTLKELLHEGLKSYNYIRIVDGTELRVLLDLGDNTSKDFKINMGNRVYKELKRARVSDFKLPEKRYTKDDQEIKKAWFSSKPMNIEEVKNMHIASYDDYAIKNTINVNKDVFDQFKQGFDMSLLGIDFKGGTYTAYNGDYNKKDLISNPEDVQAKILKESYRGVLQVTCDDYKYSLLVDPQGYDYGRYIALIE